MPITDWLHYADHDLAPICRSSSGSYRPVTDIPETGGADGDHAAASDDSLAIAADNEVAETEMPPESESPVADASLDTPEMTAAVDADEAHAEIKMGRKQRRRQEADAHSA